MYRLAFALQSLLLPCGSPFIDSRHAIVTRLFAYLLSSPAFITTRSAIIVICPVLLVTCLAFVHDFLYLSSVLSLVSIAITIWTFDTLYFVSCYISCSFDTQVELYVCKYTKRAVGVRFLRMR